MAAHIKVIPIGTIFTRWTVVGPTTRGYAVCECVCGTRRRVRRDGLALGLSKSCGCLRLDAIATHNGSHGAPGYNSWVAMIQRCHNPNNISFHNYGGRGISVCDEWRSDFSRFMADVGPRPTGAHSVDRIDGTRGYEPGNVRWATRTEQSRNRRTSKPVVLAGTKYATHAELAEAYGISSELLRGRLRAGWPIGRAVSLAARRLNGVAA